MRDGTTPSGRLRAPAFVWAGLPLVEVEGLPSYWTVDAVKPKDKGEARLRSMGQGDGHGYSLPQVVQARAGHPHEPKRRRD